MGELALSLPLDPTTRPPTFAPPAPISSSPSFTAVTSPPDEAGRAIQGNGGGQQPIVRPLPLALMVRFTSRGDDGWAERSTDLPEL